jgi:hypothetical protein
VNHQYRVTKYNPDLEFYDEWTAISDVGNSYSGVKFTLQEYERVEAAYIEAVFSFMKAAKIESLTLSDFWNGFDYSDPKLILAENAEYQNNSLKQIIKLILREKIGGQLTSQSGMFVHFGYDYYMYIGINSNHPEVISSIQNLGLYVEPFESPYLDSE